VSDAGGERDRKDVEVAEGVNESDEEGVLERHSVEEEKWEYNDGIEGRAVRVGVAREERVEVKDGYTPEACPVKPHTLLASPRATLSDESDMVLSTPATNDDSRATAFR